MMLRWVLILVLVVAGMVFAGWLTIQRSRDRATITIETQKIQQDAERLVEQGQDLADELAKPADEKATEP
jgi:CHASE3 domain sensor protein